MSTALKQSADALKRWTVEAALPVWAARGLREDGSWVEHLHLDGSADVAAERRWRVLARQVYVYAQASCAGWYDGLDVARKTYDRMRQVGYVHRVDAQGQITNDTRDFYDHDFYALASASLYAATDDTTYRVEAERIFAWMDNTLAHPKGGWAEADADADAGDVERRQNPHMHLFEASLYLHDVTGDETHLRWARAVYSLFETYFFNPKTHTIREFFKQDWTPAPGARGHIAEPGHGMEWVWLLWQYERATGTDTSDYRRKIYARAQMGRGHYLNDAEMDDGEISRETRRLWVQTEVIKAHLAMAEAGTPGSADLAAAMIDAILHDYLTPDGLWHDQLNACGTNVAQTIPVSTFYHILCVAVEAKRVAAAL